MIHRMFCLYRVALPPKSTRTPIAFIKPTCLFVTRGFSYSIILPRNLVKKYLSPLPRQNQPRNQNENDSRNENASGGVPKDGRQQDMTSVSSTSPLVPTSPTVASVSSASPSSISPPSISSPSLSSLPATPPTPINTYPSADPVEIQTWVPDLLPVQETITEKETSIERDGPFEILGLKVPERPYKPGEDDCCMSGCATCIHDIYASAHEEYTSALEAVRVALSRSTIPKTAWPKRVIELDKEVVQNGNKPEPFAGLDPGLRAFMELEAKLKSGSAGMNGSDGSDGSG